MGLTTAKALGPYHLSIDKSLSRIVLESEVRPTGVQLKRKAKLPTWISQTFKRSRSDTRGDTNRSKLQIFSNLLIEHVFWVFFWVSLKRFFECLKYMFSLRYKKIILIRHIYLRAWIRLSLNNKYNALKYALTPKGPSCRSTQGYRVQSPVKQYVTMAVGGTLNANSLSASF